MPLESHEIVRLIVAGSAFDGDRPGLARFVAVKRTKRGPAGSSLLTVTAPCPSGSFAVGGGYRLLGDLEHAKMIRSGPLISGSRPTGWVTQAKAGKRQTGWTLEATVLCARPG